ncbi:MAG: ABC transporter permease [Dongiaceae bacterium]
MKVHPGAPQRPSVAKEAADHLTSARMRFLEVLVGLAAIGAVYAATQTIRQTVGSDPFLFLTLFTTAKDPLPSFVSFLGFLVPLAAIALGFDAINTEHTRRTLSRVVAQPIYRDALLMGKFLAALLTLGILLAVLWLVVIGLGLIFLGLPPSGEEVARAFTFWAATLFYGGVWLALSMMFSVLFRQPATSALAAPRSGWIFASSSADHRAARGAIHDPARRAADHRPGLHGGVRADLLPRLAQLSVRRGDAGAAQSGNPVAGADLLRASSKAPPCWARRSRSGRACCWCGRISPA